MAGRDRRGKQAPGSHIRGPEGARARWGDEEVVLRSWLSCCGRLDDSEGAHAGRPSCSRSDANAGPTVSERAQEMLVGTGMSLVDVALSVGFQTQAHFTSVFKRYAGQPPRAWRESRGVQTGPTP